MSARPTIAQIQNGDLVTQLLGKQPTIQNGDLTISSTSGLIEALEGKADDSDLTLVNNALATKLTASNSWLIASAKRGHLALEPPSTVRGYWPCLHGNDNVDVVLGRRLLKANTVTNGFPVYTSFPRPQPLEYDGWRGDGNTSFIVPGFSSVTPNQNGLGYAAGPENPFTVEFQVQKIGAEATTWGPHVTIENETASGAPPSDNLLVLGGYQNSGTFLGWDSRTPGSYSTTT